MNEHEIFGLIQMIVVIALVVVAAALATPKGRLPLALRGLMKIMRKDRAGQPPTPGTVPVWKRLLALVLVLIAFALALIIV